MAKQTKGKSAELDSVDRRDTTRRMLRVYLDEAARFKLLTPRQEASLAQKSGSRNKRVAEKAVQRLVRHNLLLVVSVVKPYVDRPGVTFLDLIQEGNLGLFEAARRYRNGFNARFCTYAIFWIKRQVQNCLRRSASDIRVPANLFDEAWAIARFRHELEQESGRPIRNEELAVATGINLKRLAKIQGVWMTQRCLSLSSPISSNVETHDSKELQDIIADSRAEPQELVAIARDEYRKVLRALADIKVKVLSKPNGHPYWRIVVLRLGVEGDGPCYSLQEIGEMYGIKRQAIQQRQSRMRTLFGCRWDRLEELAARYRALRQILEDYDLRPVK